MDEGVELRLSRLRAEVEERTARLAAALVEIEQLKQALGTSRVIGAAIGIVMVTLKVAEPTAFDVLRLASQNSNRKLRDLADDVVRTGMLPHMPTEGSD